MRLSEIELYRVEKALKALCQTRNQNTPVELGKTEYEINAGGIFVYQQRFLLDSTHINYTTPVAKLVFDNVTMVWTLFVADKSEQGREDTWFEYPYLTSQNSLEPLLEELLHDPHNMLW